MASINDFPAQGKVIRLEEGAVIFAPSNTTYQLKLVAPGYSGPINELVEALIRGKARKLWTVASGGNFVTPIHGPTRILQGRIKYLDNQFMVVHAGVTIVVELPTDDNAYDLNNGQLTVGSLVNATILPGATFQLAAVGAAVK
jgi:hypothetical protein